VIVAGWVAFISGFVAAVYFLSRLFLKPKPKSTEVKAVRIQLVKMPCSVCGKPLEDGDVALMREGESPWHAWHRDES
jgi:hypothetical protein